MQAELKGRVGRVEADDVAADVAHGRERSKTAIILNIVAGLNLHPGADACQGLPSACCGPPRLRGAAMLVVAAVRAALVFPVLVILVIEAVAPIGLAHVRRVNRCQ